MSNVLLKENLENLDVNTIFKIESELIDNINSLEDDYKNLDLVYFNYIQMKKKVKKNIDLKKEILVKLSIQKEIFNNLEDDKKSIYLSREYTFYKEQTNTKKMVEKIKNLYSKINFLKGDFKNNEMNKKYSQIKEKYKEIIKYIKNEEEIHKNEEIPKHLNTDEKIKWLNKSINKYIEKQMIFDNYIFMLENYYNEILQKKILSIGLKEPA